MSRLPTPIVSTDWLASHLDDPSLRILDASFHLPSAGRDAAAEFLERRIRGARFFDIDDIADVTSPLPHTVPDAARFAALVGALGIGNRHRIVVYDSYGLMSAGRAWWLFRLFGHDAVAVLDGGLPKWTAEDQPTASGRPDAAHPARFDATFRAELLVGEAAITEGQAGQILDARSRARFAGEEPEPRDGLRAGHIPGSRSLPYTRLLNRADKTLRPPAELRALFSEAGVDPAMQVSTTCGSGVTACALALALARLGNDAVAIYDGSWCEWGRKAGGPVETGPPSGPRSVRQDLAEE